MTVRRYPTERLHDPGSDRALCSAPSPPPALDGGDDDDADWVARGLTSSGDRSLVASTLRWSAGGRGRGGAVRRLVGFLAGVRRTKIEAGRYKAGWMRLSAGGRKRGVAASVAGTRRGPRGGGRARAWRATATAGDRTTAQQIPPCLVSEGGVSPPAPRRSSQTRGRRWLERWG
jgi:hypothetical protein